MSEHETPVPQPNEADRDDDAIHYHEVDETDVSGTGPSPGQDAGDEEDGSRHASADDG
jgi:hypothetical protein